MCVVGGVNQVVGGFLELGSRVAVHVLRLAPHRTMILVLQEEGGGIVGVHQPQAHGASVHAGEDQRGRTVALALPSTFLA